MATPTLTEHSRLDILEARLAVVEAWIACERKRWDEITDFYDPPPPPPPPRLAPGPTPPPPQDTRRSRVAHAVTPLILGAVAVLVWIADGIRRVWRGNRTFFAWPVCPECGEAMRSAGEWPNEILACPWCDPRGCWSKLPR